MMGFMQASKTVLLYKIFKYSGRAQRSEFWWFCLASLIIGIIAGIINLIPILGQIIYVVVSLWLFLASLSVTVRRLHDVNFRGWWIAAPWVAGFLSGVVLFASGGSDAGAMLCTVLAIFAAVAMVALLVLCIMRGTAGSNRFGPDPLA